MAALVTPSTCLLESLPGIGGLAPIEQRSGAFFPWLPAALAVGACRHAVTRRRYSNPLRLQERGIQHKKKEQPTGSCSL